MCHSGPAIRAMASVSWLRVSCTLPAVRARVDNLGTKLLAYVVDKNPSTLTRWQSQRNQPPIEAVRTLRLAYQVCKLLESEQSDQTIRA